MHRIDTTAMEEKWQRRWAEAGIHRSDVDHDRPAFFLIFAYPGVTGYLHVGHMRGYTISDAIARYKRMRGYNVLFPVGTHPSGNGAISLARRIERGDEATIQALRDNGCPPDRLERMSDPEEVVRFFNEVYVEQFWKRFGFLSDWRRFTSTIYPDYQRFIDWQFRKLHDLGLLIQKPYFTPACPSHGPVAVDPSETDLSKGGTAEPLEYTLIKFPTPQGFIVTATLRPETTYGLTNLWVNPDIPYVRAEVGGEVWILSPEAAEKLSRQRDDVEVLGDADVRALIGDTTTAPIIGAEIPILPSRLCEAEVGTGAVMSVPSDAPVDWIGLLDLAREEKTLAAYDLSRESVEGIRPIPIIDTEGWGPLPAVDVTERLGITSLDDPNLEEATKEVYKTGFHKGVMNDSCGELAGIPVERAKDDVKALLTAEGRADTFHDLSEDVLCRCGERVSMAKVPDQWFIDYGDADLTSRSLTQAAAMTVLPKEYAENLPGILEWYRERACARMGNWMGTPFPFDDRWIIEPIADSTLYPVYYTLSRFANDGTVEPDQLTEAVFDYAILGRGDATVAAENAGIDSAVLEGMRAEVEYWHPLDVNLGGKEHMTVHFPVFLMNHVAILPEAYWPKGIIANHWLYMAGGRISKTKGGAQPLPDIVETYGVDALRLYYAHCGSMFVDVNWDEGVVNNYRMRLERIMSQFEELAALDGDPSPLDDWLLSRLTRRVGAMIGAMRGYDVRRFADEAYFGIPRDLRWYGRRGGSSPTVVREVLDAWSRCMAPITPHLAEELREMLGGDGLVSVAAFPEADEGALDPAAEAREDLVRDTLRDVKEILKVTQLTPSAVYVYTAPDWKVRAVGLALRPDADGMAALMKAASEDDALGPNMDGLSKYAPRLMERLRGLDDGQRMSMAMDLDEARALEDARPFLEAELGCRVVVSAADAEDVNDPEGRAAKADVRKPGIYVE